ncbi:SufD family Fe-S cluster assembly protein, partial [Candidatus Woesearchaeota archaeon]|nr:SufD family Fe-S cluster assembly protein [Candidatus Woesearchaeota archaeon]
ITSCNRDLLEDIKLLAISSGLNPMKISKWSRREMKPLGKVEKEYTHYFLYFGEGKFEKPVVFAPVSEIEYSGEEDTWDIEVEGAHNFVANGFIVHNSKVTMKYPSVYLMGRNAKADILSVALAGKGQHQDAGGKALHFAPDTTSAIISKSISKGGGRTSYRGLLHVEKGAANVKSNVRCDALILDEASRSDTYPYMEIGEDNVSITHEATVGKIGEEQVFYLMSRGLSEQQAIAMIVLGFVEPLTKELPMEYAVELNRLIQLEMTGAVG